MTSSPILNPEIPFVGAVEGGLSPGKLVNVRGKVPENAVRFAINYQLGPNINPRDDIAIHLSPRFTDGIITRNHINSMSWGPEENSGALWIQPGQAFEIIILCEPLQYRIAINGRHYTEFAHRLPYQRVTHLVIDGDVEIISVFYESINSSPSQAMPPNIPAANFGPPTAGGIYPTLGPQVPSMPQGGNNYYPNPPNTPSAYAGGYNPQSGYEKPEEESPFSGCLDKVGLAVGGLIAAGGVAAAMNAINKKKDTEDSHEKTDSSNLQNESMGLGGLGALGAALASSLATNALKGDSQSSQGYPSQDSGAGGMLGSILSSLGGSDNSSNRHSSNDLGGLGGLGSLLGGVLNKGGNQQPSYEPSGGYSRPSQSDNTTSDLINSIGGSLFSSALDSLTKHKSHGNDNKSSSYPQNPPQYEDNYGARNDIPPPYQPVPTPPSPSDNKLSADEISKGLGLGDE